jgi:hypothetical protein
MLGTLFAWQCNPVFVDKTLLASIISKFSSNHLPLARGLLVTLWVIFAGFMLWTWDQTTGRFSLAKFKSVTEVLEARKDCIGEGLLGSFHLIGDSFFINGLEVATLERIHSESFALKLSGPGVGPRVLLTPMSLNHLGGVWLGLGSDLGNVGYLVCKR